MIAIIALVVCAICLGVGFWTEQTSVAFILFAVAGCILYALRSDNWYWTNFAFVSFWAGVFTWAKIKGDFSVRRDILE